MDRARLFRILLSVLIGGVVFVYAFNTIYESDVFYHLKVGEVVWNTGAVPTSDIFSTSAAGARWVTHEWLSELVFYGIYSLAGLWGLIAFSSLLASLLFVLLLQLVRAERSFVVAAIVLLVFALLAVPFWMPRPHIFSYWFIALFLILLERYRKSGETKLLVWMGGLMVLWANMHASFIFGIGMCAYYAAALFFSCRKEKDEKGKCRFRGLAYATGAYLLLSLINPNGYESLMYVVTVMPSAKAFNVTEWQSIVSFTESLDTRLFLAVLVLTDLFLLWRLGIRRATRNIPLLLAVAGVSLMPLFSMRYLAVWLALAAYPSAQAFAAYTEERFPGLSKREGWLAAFLIFLIAVRIPLLPKNPSSTMRIPSRAVDFIEKEGIRGPLFNLYNEGGYLLWRLWPKEKVFIDGRSEVFLGAPTEEFLSLIDAREGWKRIVDEKYAFNYLVLAYWPGSLERMVHPLAEAVEKSGEWNLVYWDDASAIYVRDIPAHREVIDRFAVYAVSPFRNPADIPHERKKEALIEIQELLKRSPDSQFLKAYAFELMKTGR
jgi:hypothetical protein